MAKLNIRSSKSISIHDLKLPTISEQGKKALDIINSADANFADLEAALSADPVLMGILLKYANSPMYRTRVETKNVRQAINLLGVEIVKSAVLICTMRSFTEPLNPAKELLWEKVMQLTAMSKLIARKVGRKLADEIELTAMMSEIGGLVLSSNFISEYTAVLENAEAKRISLMDEELYYFGLHRSEITAVTMKKMRLPQISIDVLSRYFQQEVVDDVLTDIDKQLLILQLAYYFIAFSSKPELIKKDNKCQKMLELLGIENLNIDGLIESYNLSMAEETWF